MCYDIPSVIGFCLSFCILLCHAFHIMSSCALHLHTCSSHASEHFPRCPFCNPALLSPPVHPSCFLSCAGVKLSRNGPRFAKWPWYTTGRPPVKFCSIWRSFDAPTVNRVTAKAFCVLQQNPPQKPAQNPPNSLPCSRSFDHDRVGENRTSLDSPSSLYL